MKIVQSVADASGGVAAVSRGDGTWQKYEASDELPSGLFGEPSSNVPQEITMRQARLALHAIGKLDAIDAIVSAMPDPPREDIKITWEYSQTVERHNQFVKLLANSIGMSDYELDALFVAAAKL